MQFNLVEVYWGKGKQGIQRSMRRLHKMEGERGEVKSRRNVKSIRTWPHGLSY